MSSWNGYRQQKEKHGGKHISYANYNYFFMNWYLKFQNNQSNRHIPRIKSHCAEERTLDRCVQRLRKKIMLESWEARNSSSREFLHHADSNGRASLNQRTPSFFQSPSLVCMGGLGVFDPHDSFNGVDEEKAILEHSNSGSSNIQISDHVDVTSGWGGMGLRGNHSYTNLHRSASDGSGLFIGDSDNEQEDEEQLKIERRGSFTSPVPGYPEDYIKTTHMANFYYRKTQSHGDLANEKEEENPDQGDRHLSATQLSKSMIVAPSTD